MTFVLYPRTAHWLVSPTHLCGLFLYILGGKKNEISRHSKHSLIKGDHHGPKFELSSESVELDFGCVFQAIGWTGLIFWPGSKLAGPGPLWLKIHIDRFLQQHIKVLVMILQPIWTHVWERTFLSYPILMFEVTGLFKMLIWEVTCVGWQL